MAFRTPWRRLLCPFCFDRFKVSESWFRCRNPNQTQCPAEVDEQYSNHVGVPKSYLNKAFPPPAKPSLFRRGAHEVPCPVCSKSTTLRICPGCHQKLPSQIDIIDSKILAVIGGRASGKSHYIATMVKQLSSVIGPNLKVKVMAIGDATRNNYSNYYHERVYRQKLQLDQTQSAGANPVVRQPLIYRLEFPRRGLSVPAINLVLFDAAGEDIQDENTLALYNKYILHASGVLFLFNPLQIEAVCSELGGPPDDGEIIQNTLDRVVELIRTEQRIAPGGKIRIPTAFVLSKSDMLKEVVVETPAFLEDKPHVGNYDLRDFEVVNEEVKSYLSRWGEDGLLSTAEQFAPHGYFAISALGCSPDQASLAIPRIDPIRCGDPLLWLLTQLGYLRKYRSS